jgi:hypothetical protein
MKNEITSRGVTFRRPIADEKTEQDSIRNLVGHLSGKAYVLGTHRAMNCGVCGSPNTDPSTRQTEGLADLAIYLPAPPRAPDRGWSFVWIECKGRRGVLSPEQLIFRQLNQAAHVDHLVGGLDEFIAFLEPGGWVKTGSSV